MSFIVEKNDVLFIENGCCCCCFVLFSSPFLLALTNRIFLSIFSHSIHQKVIISFHFVVFILQITKKNCHFNSLSMCTYSESICFNFNTGFFLCVCVCIHSKNFLLRPICFFFCFVGHRKKKFHMKKNQILLFFDSFYIFFILN